MVFIPSHQRPRIEHFAKRGAQYLVVLEADWSGTEKGFVLSWHRDFGRACVEAERFSRRGARTTVIDINVAFLELSLWS